MPRLLLVYLIATAPLFVTTAARADTLVVTVTGARSAEGSLRIGVYRPNGMQAATKVVAASSAPVRVEFDLPRGDYAVKMLHDADGDGRIDRGSFGLPSGYAFSNGARGTFGEPSFAAMRIVLDGRATATLKVRY